MNPKERLEDGAQGPTARALALEVLARVEQGGAYAAAALNGELQRASLEARDAGLATELVYGVLRWQGALDARLGEACHRPLDQLDPIIRLALRLGAYQLLGGLRVPAHAAVDETVTLARDRRGRGAGGLVNAVLRKIAANPGALEPKDALPPWLAAEIAGSLGDEALEEIARWSVEQPWMGLRLELGRPDAPGPEELKQRLLEGAPGSVIEESRWLAQALKVKNLGPISGLEAYRRGWITSQDEGAQRCAALLDLSPGQRVLDACCGRGGKTLALASMAPEGVQIDAADRHPGKLRQLATELKRVGRTGVSTVSVDLERGLAGLNPPYDRLLLDAPCTGTGTLSRKPELRWRLGPDDLDRLVAVQGRLLERCAQLLAPEGALVYCVCSILDREGPDQVARLTASGQWRVTEELRISPHLSGSDGFYAARLVKGEGAEKSTP